MKTVEQVEPRTLIDTVPYTISSSGSYYLSADLVVTGLAANTSGIIVDSDHVTIDMNGYRIRGASTGVGTGVGIQATNGAKRTHVRNGFVENFDGAAIVLGDYAQVRDISVTGPSAQGGVLAGTYSIVERVQASDTGGDGINVGSASLVNLCVAEDNFANGIYAGEHSIVSRCIARENGTLVNTRGIDVDDGSQVTHCIVANNKRHGMAGSRTYFYRNTAISNGYSSANNAGISIGGFSRVEANVCLANNQGLRYGASRSLIINNYLYANTNNNYVSSGGPNIIGFYETDTGTITNENPYINFDL